MARTKHYKTLSGLFRNTGIKYFTLWNLISKHVYDSVHHMPINLELSPELEKQCADMFAAAFCSTKPTQHKYSALIQDYYGNCYGIFERLWISKTPKGIFDSTYCAGQDWVSETRTLQSILRR